MNIGEAQVLFAGNRAKLTSVQSRMITASIAAGHFTEVGKYEINISKSRLDNCFLLEYSALSQK